MTHFRTVCMKCSKVINQCRCIGPKEEREGLCQRCMRELSARVESNGAPPGTQLFNVPEGLEDE